MQAYSTPNYGDLKRPGRPIVSLLFLLVLWTPAIAQETAPTAGMRHNTPQVHALTNVRIVQSPGRMIDKGTVILRDGVIQAVGADAQIPADAHIWDYAGHTVYAGLIETYSQVGLPKHQPDEENRGRQHWNASVHPQDHAADLYQIDGDGLTSLRKLGFTAAMVLPSQGIFSGSGSLIALGDGTPNDNIIQTQVAQHVRLERNRNRTYPGSLMGVIALIRQTFLDADWHRKAHEAYRQNPTGQTMPEDNEALAALEQSVRGQQPVLMAVRDEQSFLRAASVASEFNLKLWVKGSGHEYRLLNLIKKTGSPVIVPVTFPHGDDLNVATPEDALNVSLEQLRHWEAAPENPGKLQAAGIPFVLTSAGLEKASDFPGRVRQAIERGLDYDAALAAVTTTPVRMFGLSNRLGTIEAGKLAYLTVTDGPLFGNNANVRDVWVDGRRYEVTPVPAADPRGRWEVTMTQPTGSAETAELELQGTIRKLSGTMNGDRLERAMLDQKRVGLVFSGDKMGFSGVIRMSGGLEGERLSGGGVLPDGKRFTWSATRSAAHPTPSKPMPVASDESSLPPVTPPGAFGRATPPDSPKHVVVRGATVWTLDEQGKVEDTDILVTDGRIARIGKDLQTPSGAVEVDAVGKHVTPGIIDAHSHTAIQEGINEGAQAVTAEVGIGDVIQSYDIAIYRELAGGLTSANVLHGSANPIGGKNQFIKLRWGSPPEDLKFEGAKPGIKFALGENVKRSSGTGPQTRYPASRMGVEQLIRDRFKAAQDYDRAWTAYNALKDNNGVIPPRRDLELDTLLEILKGERMVHSHSYRQDEILMLIRIADDFGFTIGTFQHVLEGYKVADAIAKHGAGASTFSDWWGYKFEAFDAIPYNGAIMHNAGVLVTFNSDSSELARRLNTEAAKAVKYGGVSEIEALKFVTLNAAKQFQIDDRVGSLEVGKDADFTIWSGHPLSTYTRCEQTWIEGKKYFDLDEDKKLRAKVMEERAILIQKLLAPKKDDKPEA